MEHLTDSQLRNMYYCPKISKTNIKLLELNALDIITTICSKYKNICLGYSGGKDSIAIQSLLDKAKIKYTAIIWQTMFQFPENQKWIKEHGPEGLVFQKIDRPNVEDLKADNSLLFSMTKEADNTYMRYKWSSQRKYLSKQKFDLFVTGRRIAESNNCGKKNDNFVRKGKEYDSFSPIATWSSEEVFAYLKYNNIDLPWQYVNTINGFAYGSVAWTERRRFGHLYSTLKDRLNEVYDADKSVLMDLRNDISEIDVFLKEKGI